MSYPAPTNLPPTAPTAKPVGKLPYNRLITEPLEPSEIVWTTRGGLTAYAWLLSEQTRMARTGRKTEILSNGGGRLALANPRS